MYVVNKDWHILCLGSPQFGTVLLHGWQDDNTYSVIVQCNNNIQSKDYYYIKNQSPAFLVLLVHQHCGNKTASTSTGRSGTSEYLAKKSQSL